MGKFILTALALDLDEDGEVRGSLAVPGLEGLEQLETFRLGVNRDLDRGTVLRRGLEGVLARIVSTRRELIARRVREFELLSIRACEGVCKRVEGEGTSECEGGDDVGRGDKGVCSGVSVVTASEVTVVGGDDCESSFINSVK